MKCERRAKFVALFIVAAAFSGLLAGARSGPEAQKCTDPVVWEFVADVAARFPGCKTLPNKDMLRNLSCHPVELAQLESGCFPETTPVENRPASSYLGAADRRIEDRTIGGFLAGGGHPCRQVDQSERYLGKAPRLRIDDKRPTLAIACQGSDQSCARTIACRREGRCTNLPRQGEKFGTCRVGGDADCAQSERCSGQQQECVSALFVCTKACEDPTLADIELPTRRMQEPLGYCMPFAGEKDCSSTRACAKYGLCTNRDGFCIAGSDANCRQSEICAERGACVAVHGSCQALLDVDMRESQLCKGDKNSPGEGLCRLSKWSARHIITDEEAESKCEKPLRLVDGECQLPPDYDCKSSDECKEEGKCVRYIDQNCDRDGRCSDKFAVCVRSDAYCQAQPECAELGKCAHLPREMVVVTPKCNDMLQRRSMKVPVEHKRFVAPSCGKYSYGRCVLSNAGCAATEGCATSGMCSADSLSRYCRPTTAAHCERSRGCKEHGQCGLSPNSTYQLCAATAPEHCEASTDCKESGACTLRPGGVCEPSSADK